MSPKSAIDPVRILVRGIQMAKFENKELGEGIRNLAEVIEGDLSSVNYEPDESVVEVATEVAGLIVSDITYGTANPVTMIKGGKRVEVEENEEEEDDIKPKFEREEEDEEDED